MQRVHPIPDPTSNIHSKLITDLRYNPDRRIGDTVTVFGVEWYVMGSTLRSLSLRNPLVIM
jgi:hypothetical protein